jgi:hypothetical protein
LGRFGTHPSALSRVVRLLAAKGVFELRGDRVAHTPASRLLRRDHPQTVSALVWMFGIPFLRVSFDELDYSVANFSRRP